MNPPFPDPFVPLPSPFCPPLVDKPFPVLLPPGPLPNAWPPFPSFATDGHSRRRSSEASTTEALGRPAHRCHVVLQVLALALVVDLPDVHRGGAFHLRHLVGQDGLDLGRHLAVVQLVPDRLVHEFLGGLATIPTFTVSLNVSPNSWVKALAARHPVAHHPDGP